MSLIWALNFFQPLYHSYQLDTMPAYHNMQNQENLMTQTQENDRKPQIWANLGLICPILGQFFFRKSDIVTFFDLLKANLMQKI